MALILLGASLSLWVYALLTLRWYVANMDLARVVPALFLAAIVVAGPPLWWTLLCEWTARVEVSEGGLRLRSWGLELAFPWGMVKGLKSGSVSDTLELKVSVLPLIRNPLVRLLYWQAYGSHGVPLWKGLEDRERLMNMIGKYTDVIHGEEG